MVLVIAAVGTSGSGKTTALEYLISHLSDESYKIGSVKHVHHEGFTMDQEGTNTWRYAQAGAKVIVAVSPDEIAIIKREKVALNNLDQITALVERESLDILFVEGFHRLVAKRTDVPKIITADDEENLKRTLEGTVEPILAITGVISENKPKVSGLKIPILSLETEGEQLVELVKRCFKEKLGTLSKKTEAKKVN
ncbi:MAG TPA: molybdopterin-guanine dinucleotide biosynthesis protein B [Candidatus Nanoarchaeia archaeon]|nr:molybdopterin-guanine dinucleotide biosynthesis protein B [Candidatus Nanoarchaeia archaeon]